MLVSSDTQGVVVFLHEKVTQDENDALLLDRIVEITDGRIQVRTLAFRFEGEQLAHDGKYVFLAFFCRDIGFDPVAEEDGSYFVVVVGSGEGQYGAYFGDQVLLALVNGAEEELALTSTSSIMVSSRSSSNSLE